MEMMDRDRTVELEGLSAFFDGDKSDQSSFVNPLGGNRIIARGSVGRWDGTSHGLTAYRDFDDMMRGADSVFKDCEIGKVWDENGSLFVHGYHHDGGVDVELRQLTDAGEEALDAIEDAWVGEEFTIAGKTYDGSAQSTMDALDDLWENPALCPAPHYMELAFGCPAEEWEEPTLDPPSRHRRVHSVRHHERRGRLGRRECDRARYIRHPLHGSRRRSQRIEGRCPKR